MAQSAAGSQDANSGVRFERGRKSAELLYVYDGHFYVKTQINNAPPVFFLLDTGAFTTLIARSYAQSLGLAPMFDVEKREFFEAPLKFDGLRVNNQRFDGQHLAACFPTVGIQVCGILGYDFIKNFVLVFDHQKGTVSVHDARTYKHPDGDGANSEVIPVNLSDRTPHTKIDLFLGRSTEPTKIDVMFDTGSPIPFCLTGEFIAKVRESGETFQAVRIGPRRIPLQDPVTCPKAPLQKGPTNFDGLLGGLAYLFPKVVFDYQNSRVIITHLGDSRRK